MHVYCFHLSSLDTVFSPVPWTRCHRRDKSKRDKSRSRWATGVPWISSLRMKRTFCLEYPMEYPWNQDLISTRVIAVYGYIDV